MDNTSMLHLQKKTLITFNIYYIIYIRWIQPMLIYLLFIFINKILT